MQVILNVFRKPSRIIIALVSSGLFLFFVLLFPNLQLLGDSYRNGASLSDIIGLMIDLTGSLSSNFTNFSRAYTLVNTVLFGINIALTSEIIANRLAIARTSAHGVRMGKHVGKSVSLGMVGTVVSLFGIGCAACGTFIFASAFASLGALGALSYLPFGGEEFGVIGILFLTIAIYAAYKQLKNPPVCEVDIM